MLGDPGKQSWGNLAQGILAENGSFSQEIGTFRLFFLQTAGRSFVENDRSPSFLGAPDWWESARFQALFWGFKLFPIK
jgi:hypothetical protein